MNEIIKHGALSCRESLRAYATVSRTESWNLDDSLQAERQLHACGVLSWFGSCHHPAVRSILEPRAKALRSRYTKGKKFEKTRTLRTLKLCTYCFMMPCICICTPTRRKGSRHSTFNLLRDQIVNIDADKAMELTGVERAEPFCNFVLCPPLLKARHNPRLYRSESTTARIR